MSLTLGEFYNKNIKNRRSNSAIGRNILGSNLFSNYLHSSANDDWKLRKYVAEHVGDNSPYPPSADTSFSTQSKLGHPTRKETRTSKNSTVKKTGLYANTPPNKDKVDKKSKKNTTSKKTSGEIGLYANIKSKKTTKYKMVTAPHRNPTNKKVRVIDRPGKPRPKNNSGSSRF